ncbi:hypothetical protein Ciccas_012318, partial [Cichlidogyrus casuarinus]
LKKNGDSKSSLLDLSKLLTVPQARTGEMVRETADDRIMVPLSLGLSEPENVSNYCVKLAAALPPDRHLDAQILRKIAPAIDSGSEETFSVSATINNSDRCFGATLSYAISMKFQESGLPYKEAITINLIGQAGQSFCAFLTSGIKINLQGDANDSVCKGLSGGFVVIKPTHETLNQPAYRSEDNIIVGNVCLYGATAGKLFIRGQAAERFCVRNSGATVVVEGAGHNGCEYMTGGRVVILGPVGRNFAAGMSGGLAFVYDPDNRFDHFVNLDMVDVHEMTADNAYCGWLKQIVNEFIAETGSEVARVICDNWSNHLSHFKLVFPKEYKLALEKLGASPKQVRNKELGLIYDLLN